MSKIRPMGDIIYDMEKILEEMVDSHDLQKGDIIALAASWIDRHRPSSIESYLDGSIPVLYYGPIENIKIKGDE